MNNEWINYQGLEGRVHYPQFLTEAEFYFANYAHQYFDGLVDGPFEILKESDGIQLPDPNIQISAMEDTRYIFFMIHDGVSIRSDLANIVNIFDTENNEVKKSLTVFPLNLYFDETFWNTLEFLIFGSLRVSQYLLTDVPYEDENGNPSTVMKLVGKIKNHRDPGHIIVPEDGENIEKYGSYLDY